MTRAPSGATLVREGVSPFRACQNIIRSGIYDYVVFIESRAFTARLRELAGGFAATVLDEIQQELLKNPSRGDVVPGLAGIRKARISNPARGKGKRGGYRYLFLYLEHRQHIHLLILLDKNEQEDLTKEERKSLRRLVEQIRVQSE